MAYQPWVRVLQATEGAFEAFVAHLEGLLAEAQQRVDDSPAWEGVLEARGAKKEIDKMLKGLNMQAREESAYAEYRRTR